MKIGIWGKITKRSGERWRESGTVRELILNVVVLVGRFANVTGVVKAKGTNPNRLLGGSDLIGGVFLNFFGFHLGVSKSWFGLFLVKTISNLIF